jgi:aminocarboxymuconate-semialdehyde decarboxylase
VDSLVHDARALRLIMDVFPRVAIGSDYPFPLGEQKPGALVNSMDFPPETLHRLLAGNALEWLGRRADAYDL